MCVEGLHRQTDESEEFPDKKFAEKCWTHSLTTLLDIAGLGQF
jgi:hypothetical protein